jgi:tetratricopeptide (TPR) repeat protein
LRFGELLARNGDLAAAEKHLTEAVQAVPRDQRALEELVAVEAAAGKNDEARKLAQEGLSRFPLSYLLQNETGNPNLVQLANDPTRVLNISAQYMRLGSYQKALAVLDASYPTPAPDQSEPGTVAPQKHPMVAYFRGYCHETLGQSPEADYSAASKLSPAFVFPNTAEEFAVLSAALKARPTDATAHYLMGTFYFSRGETDPALSEWAEAHKHNPDIPVLSASTGLALLHIKNEPEQALAAFRDGLRSDPSNIAIYLGIDQALSLLKRPARERVEALEKYPHLDNAPPSLIYELILNLTEAGNFDRATSLFHNRFFPREEGGTNVRQVWIEVQLQHALAAAKSGQCGQALTISQNIGKAVPDLAFTRDGLEPILQTARSNYLLGYVYKTCGKAEEAKVKFQAAAGAAAPDQIRWAWLAAKELPGFEPSQWQSRLQTSFDQAASRSETSAFPSYWNYAAGSLAQELGKSDEVSMRFRNALLLPDRMLAYHFTRLAAEKPKP